MAWLLRAGGGGGDGDDGPAFGHVDVFTPFDGNNVTANGREAKTVLDHNNTRRNLISDKQRSTHFKTKFTFNIRSPAVKFFVHFGMIKTIKKNKQNKTNNFGGE